MALKAYRDARFYQYKIYYRKNIAKNHYLVIKLDAPDRWIDAIEYRGKDKRVRFMNLSISGTTDKYKIGLENGKTS